MHTSLFCTNKKTQKKKKKKKKKKLGYTQNEIGENIKLVYLLCLYQHNRAEQTMFVSYCRNYGKRIKSNQKTETDWKKKPGSNNSLRLEILSLIL